MATQFVETFLMIENDFFKVLKMFTRITFNAYLEVPKSSQIMAFFNL